MVGHFLRLKLALVRGAVRGEGLAALAGLVVSALLALAAGIGAGVAFALLRAVPEHHVDALLSGGFALLLLGWTFGPLFVAGSEGTLEADRLALLPLAPRQLMAGLMASSLVGVGGLITVLAVAGAVVGTAPLSPLLVLSVLAAGLQLGLCAATGRLVLAAISAATRTRRWRDVAMFAVPAAAIGLNLLGQLASRSLSDERRSVARDALRLLSSLLPSGLPAAAMVHARDGRWLAGAVAVAAGVVVLALVLWLWWRALQRMLTTAASGTTARARGGAASLFPPALRWLPADRVGAVAAKELRVLWRDPRQRAALAGQIFAAMVVPVSAGAGLRGEPRAVLVAALPALMVGLGAANQYGYDGPAHWMNVAAGDDAAADLRGKNLARAIVAAPLVVAAVAGLAVVAGSASYVPAALALAVAAFGTAMAVANPISVIAPVPMPESSTNVFSVGAPGRGLSSTLPTLVGMVVVGAVLGPVAMGLALSESATVRAVLAAGCVIAGPLAWKAGLAAAVHRSAGRQPELLEALGPRRSG